jgi:hypothetical protein
MINDIFKSLNRQPLWTIWSLILCPLFYLSLAFASLMIGIINLNVDDAITMWKENT